MKPPLVPTALFTYSRFKINQDCSWDVACVVALVVENVLTVTALSRKVLEVSVLADPVLLAKLLPKLTAN